MNASKPPERSEADKWANRVRLYIGILGGAIMLGIAIVREDLTLGVLAYGFVAIAVVEAIPEINYRMIALAAVGVYVAYMFVNSWISLPGELDNWEAAPPVLTPMLASWGAWLTHNYVSARAARKLDKPDGN